MSALPNGELSPIVARPTAISMFSGAGGMDLGFTQAGFQIIWANDIDQGACRTYESNLGLKPHLGDVQKVKTFPPADILVACNPCQGFSQFGKRDPEDPRNNLYQEIGRCLRQTKPKYLVVENVPGLAWLYEGRFLYRMLIAFQRAGYKIQWKILDAKSFGVPQDRKRIFIVGVRRDLNLDYKFPEPTHGKGLKAFVTLKDAIGDLKRSDRGECYRGSFSFFYMSRNRRRTWGQVSRSILSMERYIPLHPSCPPLRWIRENKWVFTAAARRYRRLSIRECARIQTFPDSFKFCGGRKRQYELIGNAVPPLLAKKIALSVLRLESERVAPQLQIATVDR